MSWNPDLDRSIPLGSAVDAIETVIIPRARDLGGFEVRRALPSTQRQMVGPFIFFDQMGPAEFLTGQGHRCAPASPYWLGHGDLSSEGPYPSPRLIGDRCLD